MLCVLQFSGALCSPVLCVLQFSGALCSPVLWCSVFSSSLVLCVLQCSVFSCSVFSSSLCSPVLWCSVFSSSLVICVLQFSGDLCSPVLWCSVFFSSFWCSVFSSSLVLCVLQFSCLSHAVQREALSILTPLQVGVGVKLGCEAIVHSVSRVLEDPSIPSSDRWALMLDFSNAFNSVDRSFMFKEIRERIPSLSPWMESCYGAQPILYLGDETIKSSCGVQQGDPLGPLGFALALQPIVEQILLIAPDLCLVP